MAYLDIEDGIYPIADSALDQLLALDSTNVEWLAWRAQSAFEEGNADTGAAFYARALANADHDSTGALWRQVVGIARPGETGGYDRLSPARRGDWLRGFWARRNPDLFAGINRRIGEHFQRLRYARRNYALQHPLITYHRSQIARALNLEPARAERDFYQRCEMSEVPGGPTRARDRARIELGNDPATPQIPAFFDSTIFVPLNMDLRSVDTSAARVGYNLATGLDDRGILYLRFGPPDGMMLGGRNTTAPGCITPDLEIWRYDDIGEVRFARPSAFSRGERTVSEMVFRSMNSAQFDAMTAALTRDRTSEPAPLEFGVWTAQFAGASPGKTAVAAISTRGALAASVTHDGGAEGDVRRGVNGFVILEGDPGRYTLLAHARDSSRLGRQALAVAVRATTGLALSDLLLAPAWNGAPPARFWDMLRHVQRNLVFAEGQPMRVFGEVYGLTPAGTTVRYRADYTLLRTDNPARDYGIEEWSGAVQFGFEREAEASAVAREMLDITPERLPPGKYLLRLRVTDRVAERDAGRSQIAFEVK